MPAHPLIAFIALFPAVFLSQAPGFMQQYEQRLGGAVDELEIVVRNFDEDSHRSGYDRLSALRLMTKNPERLIRDQAIRMEESVARLNRLRGQLDTFGNEGSFGRLASFAMRFDRPLAERTCQSYKMTLPLTIEGGLFAGIGFFGFYFLGGALANASRRRRSSEAEA
jgi:hypothetical protein